MTRDTVALFVSQSGETADTLAALRHARQAPSVVNVPSSTRESDLPADYGGNRDWRRLDQGLHLPVDDTRHARTAGPCGGRLNPAQLVDKLTALRGLPGLMNQALGIEDRAKEISLKLAEARDNRFWDAERCFRLP